MIQELNQAIEHYHQKWHELVAARTNRAFFEHLEPTSVGWKTVDRADFDTRFAQLRDQCDHIDLGWVNSRWIATMHLKDEPLRGNMRIVKLKERRPGSADAPGLDHLDFAVADQAQTAQLLAQESGLRWEEEVNGFGTWLSIWFADTEAKLRQHGVLDVCIAELQALRPPAID